MAITVMPASAQADRVQLIYDEEATYGIFEPGGTPYKELRFTSESLQKTTESVVSQEIRSDRQNVDVIRTGIGAAGDLNFELSYATYDDYLRWALMNSAEFFPPIVIIDAADTSIAAVAASNEFTHATGWAIDPSAINVWIKVSGFVTAANNGIWKVASFTSTSIVVLQTGVIVDESATPAVSITEGAQLVNGTTFWSHSIQREYTDLSGPAVFERFTSMAVNTMALNVPVDGIITGTFGLLGQTAVSSAADIEATPTLANTNETMAAVEDVLQILENQTAYGSMGFTMNLNNNLRPRLEIGTLGSISVGAGTIDVTGNIQAYFKSSTELDRYLNFNSSNIAIVFQDSAGNNYVIDIPEVKYTDGKRVTSGRNTDIIADLSWQAKRDTVEGHTIKIVKFT